MPFTWYREVGRGELCLVRNSLFCETISFAPSISIHVRVISTLSTTFFSRNTGKKYFKCIIQYEKTVVWKWGVCSRGDEYTWANKMLMHTLICISVMNANHQYVIHHYSTVKWTSALILSAVSSVVFLSSSMFKINNKIKMTDCLVFKDRCILMII